MENNKNRNLVIKVVGGFLMGVGLATLGLWPYQLPCCAIGGFLLGVN